MVSDSMPGTGGSEMNQERRLSEPEHEIRAITAWQGKAQHLQE